MKIYLLPLSAAFVLAACSNTSAIEEAVRQNLIDPDSAKFGEIVEYIDADGKAMACVMVNAKNRMGGYTGESIVVAMKTSDGEWQSVGDGPEGYDCDGWIALSNKSI